jgi:ferritin-like metal-binding protein YciE
MRSNNKETPTGGTEVTQNTQTQSTEKQKELVRKYLSDMNALEGHIYQAIDKQVKGTQDEPDVNPILRNFRDTLERHTKALQSRLDALGGNPANPIKEIGSSILGLGAGLIDKIRSEEVSKDFRDNYTALSLSNISYVMLATTALACNDRETAELAGRHLKDNAGFVMEIGKLIPYVVVRDLKDESDLNPNAVEEAQQIYADAWDK